MSGLRPYPELQETLAALPLGHRNVGWSILTSLARAELRRGRTVILDGVARVRERDLCARTADAEGGRLLVVRTECSDPELHREHVERRRREIPDWYELTWESVLRSAETWEAPAADLVLDAARPWGANADRRTPSCGLVHGGRQRARHGGNGEAGSASARRVAGARDRAHVSGTGLRWVDA